MAMAVYQGSFTSGSRPRPPAGQVRAGASVFASGDKSPTSDWEAT